MITITDTAQAHFRKLVEKQSDREVQLKIEAINPGTPNPECGIRFFKPGPEDAEYVTNLAFDGFILYFDRRDRKYLEEAFIDFKQDGLNGELIVDTPNLQAVSSLDENAPLMDQIQFVIDSEINPAIASHGGQVKVLEIKEDNTVVLQFGGGCQGCSMIDVTLKQGVEKTLKERIPEIKAIVDATDHTAGEMPYY